MSAEWIRTYRSPGRDTEVWELRHRSGALLAEMNVYRSTATGWWVFQTRTIRWISYGFTDPTEAPHRRMLRATRALIHRNLDDYEARESPPSITDTELSIVEENAETIRRDGSVRSRRRARRARQQERAEEQARKERVWAASRSSGASALFGDGSELALVMGAAVESGATIFIPGLFDDA